MSLEDFDKPEYENDPQYRGLWVQAQFEKNGYEGGLIYKFNQEEIDKTLNTTWVHGKSKNPVADVYQEGDEIWWWTTGSRYWGGPYGYVIVRDGKEAHWIMSGIIN